MDVNLYSVGCFSDCYSSDFRYPFNKIDKEDSSKELDNESDTS